jgi:hypothetical protein
MRRAGFDQRQQGWRVTLLIMLERAAILTGLMPVFDSEQPMMTVAICSGRAIHAVEMNIDTADQHEQQADCPFARLRSPAVPTLATGAPDAAGAPNTLAWSRTALSMNGKAVCPTSRLRSLTMRQHARALTQGGLLSRQPFQAARRQPG